MDGTTRTRIRDATAADAPAIAAIWNPIVRDTVVTFWPHERTEAEIARLIVERQAAGWAFLVAEAAEVQGFASFFQFRGGPGYARTMELTINLAPEARGRGLGAALIQALEARATAAGARVLIGAVTGSNDASLAFHRRMGFVEMGRIPQAGWKFGRFHDLVLMGRTLGFDMDHDTDRADG
jgi:phosphinothricin acetyltransferase